LGNTGGLPTLPHGRPVPWGAPLVASARVLAGWRDGRHTPPLPLPRGDAALSRLEWRGGHPQRHFQQWESAGGWGGFSLWGQCTEWLQGLQHLYHWVLYEQSGRVHAVCPSDPHSECLPSRHYFLCLWCGFVVGGDAWSVVLWCWRGWQPAWAWSTNEGCLDLSRCRRPHHTRKRSPPSPPHDTLLHGILGSLAGPLGLEHNSVCSACCSGWEGHRPHCLSNDLLVAGSSIFCCWLPP